MIRGFFVYKSIIDLKFAAKVVGKSRGRDRE
jgi:hypothetical protein